MTRENEEIVILSPPPPEKSSTHVAASADSRCQNRSATPSDIVLPAFRKPFTAAGFADTRVWGLDFKTVVVSTQVLGYMMSKFIGIRVIFEMC